MGICTDNKYFENMDEYVDWRYVLSIFSMREYGLNLSTKRKQFFFTFYVLATLILTLVIVQRKTAIGEFLVGYVEYTLLSLAVVLYSVEPCVLIIQALILPHPGADDDDNDNGTKNASDVNKPVVTVVSNNTESTADIAIVISCHRSSDVIVKTVKACLKHVHPHQVFVMDNANFLDPPDNTREVLDEADLHEVNYIYNPFGNKTLAMFAGSVAAKDFKYLLLIDDDVTIPPDMKFGKHLFSSTVRAVCYPIRATHPQGRTTSLFIEWQGIEYKMADYAKLLQNEFSTVLFPHGAICLWERNTLIHCFRSHDTIFYADDVKMGLWFQRQGYEMRMYHKSMVETEAPTTIVGPYPNFYNQRVRSWDMAEHAYAYEFFRVFFLTRHKTFTGTLVLKWFQFYSCYSVLADWIRIPVMALTIWVSWRFFMIISASFVGLYTLLTIAWDYLGYRRCPERRSRLIALLTFQVYKIPSIFIRLLGMGRAFFVYLPNFKSKPTIPQLEKEYAHIATAQKSSAPQVEVEESPNLIAMAKFPVWLDKTNPYYAHYDPKDPTYTGKYETEPDVPEERPTALHRDPDSDSVTTLTMDEALMRDQDSLSTQFRVGQKSREKRKRRTSLTPSVESNGEGEIGHVEEEMKAEEDDEETAVVVLDEEMPSIAENEEYKSVDASISRIPLVPSSADSAVSSVVDSYIRPKPLSVVPEESVEVSTEPSAPTGQSRAGQETSDSSGAFTSALGHKTHADGSSISTLTYQQQQQKVQQYPSELPPSEAPSAFLTTAQRTMVDTVPDT